MKTINQFRKTNSFCILSQDMENLTKVLAFVKTLQDGSMVACANDKDDMNRYTIRVVYNRKDYRVMEDLYLQVAFDGQVKIIDREVITRYSLPIARSVA